VARIFGLLWGAQCCRRCKPIINFHQSELFARRLTDIALPACVMSNTERGGDQPTNLYTHDSEM
jgi:hypothetical protein